MIIFWIILAFLAFFFVPIICDVISDFFHDLRYKRYLLRNAHKSIMEAKSWKTDVEYYLNLIKKNGPMTFYFEGSSIKYNYQQMSSLLNRINAYLQNYEIYVTYVEANQWYGLLEPKLRQEDEISNPFTLEQHISNLATVISQETEIRFLKYLHQQQKS